MTMNFGQLLVAVHLLLRSTETGGRRTAIIGEVEGFYRPNWSVEDADPEKQTGAPVLFINPTTVRPGERARAVLVPLYPPHWVDVLVGTQLFMYEGARECGIAEVIAVWTSINPNDVDVRDLARLWVTGT